MLQTRLSRIQWCFVFGSTSHKDGMPLGFPKGMTLFMYGVGTFECMALNMKQLVP